MRDTSDSMNAGSEVEGREHREADADGGFEFDVVGIGSPLVDILATAGEKELKAVGLEKGSMSLVTLERARNIYDAMGSTVEVSGGSAANTMVGLAALGGSAGFVGKVADDDLGVVFAHDIRAAGVAFEPAVGPAGSSATSLDGLFAAGGAEHGSSETQDDAKDSSTEEEVGTGRCLVLVTPDAERTMATHLGVATTIGPHDIPEEFVARHQIVYLEGYLWDLPPAIEAMRKAISIAHEFDRSVALSLSDPFCVERHQDEFLELVQEDIDILFGNEEEVTRLFKATCFEDAINAASETGLLVAVTRGPLGSVVTTPHGPVSVPAEEVENVVDTTGAGDLYAAGFLYALCHDLRPQEAAQLGGLCASEVIGHMGARPQADLGEMARRAGLK
ncbi:MAG: adenosine kinase [Acidimicrobiales bacterium]